MGRKGAAKRPAKKPAPKKTARRSTRRPSVRSQPAGGPAVITAQPMGAESIETPATESSMGGDGMGQESPGNM